MTHTNPSRQLLAALGAGILILGSLASCASSGAASPARGKAPAWYDDLQAVYPNDQYLAFMGSGPDLEAARADATAQLANFFGMTVKAVSQGSVEYTDKGSGPKAEASQLSRSVSQTVRTESTQKLYAVKYSDPFVQKNRTHLVAYLVLKDTLNQIRSEKKARLDAVNHYLELAGSADSVLERHIKLLAANALIPRVAELDSLLRTLGASVGVEAGSLQSQARALADSIRSKMTVEIKLDDPEALVGNLLNESLSSLDIRPSAKGSLTLSATASAKPIKLASQTMDLHTHEWLIKLNLVDEVGNTWFANQATGRSSGSSDDAAKLRARMEIEKYIKNQFTPALLEKLLAKVEER